MAYADYEFYSETYMGSVLTEDSADAWLERASDELDVVTFHRLRNGLPDDTYYQDKIKKAVCAIAENLYQVDALQKATAASVDENGTVRGPVSSISSGKESISFGASSSVYSKAASSALDEGINIQGIAARYLRGVPAADGVLLLYAGKEGSYAR